MCTQGQEWYILDQKPHTYNTTKASVQTSEAQENIYLYKDHSRRQSLGGDVKD